jgi:hypothetical protein
LTYCPGFDLLPERTNILPTDCAVVPAEPVPDNHENEWRARGAWVRTTGKPADKKEPESCHKARKDVRAGFFWLW